MLNDTDTPAVGELELSWAPDAPKGGKTVMNRILKDGANVPLFFAQTLVSSLRDQGYNDTTSALCEHVDNSIQAGASEVRIYFRQTGKPGAYKTDVAVLDNGQGMAPNVLKVAMAFGGSMNFNNRSGIGRFGMGMKTAALSMSPLVEFYSWQEVGAIYNLALDVEAIGRERSNNVFLPDPELLDELPDDVADIIQKPMSIPKDRSQQELLAEIKDDLEEALGSSGTIIFMPNCDRLSFAKANTLVDHATKEMARVYRHAIGDGLKLFINNRQVTAFDPTYSMANARHRQYLDEIEAKGSKLVTAKLIEIPIHDKEDSETAQIKISLFKLPIEEWYHLPQKTLRNDLHVFNGQTVSILRNGRELFADRMPELTTRHSITHWFRVQIDFPGDLDEAFGVAANKQGVRPKGYVKEAIKKGVGEDISTVINEIRRFQSEQRTNANAAKPSTSENKATASDPHQSRSLALSAEEEVQIEENLRTLAVTLKRANETDDEAFKRVKASRYLIQYVHDDYWPFYRAQHRYGRVILSINTAHPFFSELYDPIRKLDGADGSDNDENNGAKHVREQTGPLVALELLLLSLARTQSALSLENEDANRTLETLQREWSETLRIQLTS
ncbi:ATP-binding protein [Pseudovibrio sp. POLY-S9]|uniref:ATP-binding protein n=1 Tax=Pseudovibrio sp. POLY-S9 TaxID=1576596 RepID=UPI000B08D623|nr:ATP-binding protein [Pseudovibrio sp. POLY-S9]